jgi:hypothetical protein
MEQRLTHPDYASLVDPLLLRKEGEKVLSRSFPKERK